jgi:hypothetical protein
VHGKEALGSNARPTTRIHRTEFLAPIVGAMLGFAVRSQISKGGQDGRRIGDGCDHAGILANVAKPGRRVPDSHRGRRSGALGPCGDVGGAGVMIRPKCLFKIMVAFGGAHRYSSVAPPKSWFAPSYAAFSAGFARAFQFAHPHRFTFLVFR